MSADHPKAAALGNLGRARRFYEQRAWADAFQAFRRADQESPLEAEDLELLALAAYLAGRDEEYLRTLERAYHAHVNAAQRARAGSCAFWLGFRVLMRGEMGYLLLPTVGQGLVLPPPLFVASRARPRTG